MAITTIKIGGATYPAACRAVPRDNLWNGRSVTLITMAVDAETIQTLFPAGAELRWSTVVTRELYIERRNEDGMPVCDEKGNPVVDAVEKAFETDQSLWCLCGPIIDNRDGTYTVKMGKRLASEVQAELDEAEAALKIIMEGE